MRLKSVIEICVFAIVVSATVGARADSDERRKMSPFIGIGMARTFAKVQQPGVDASLSGWSSAAEGGFDVPFSSSFGFQIGAEIADSDLTNNYKSDDYLDQTTFKSKAARAGFYYKNLTLGYGYRLLTVDLKTVSSTSGASSAHLEGSGTYGYGAFTIDHRGLMRGSLEVQANTTNLNGFSYTDYSVGLRAYILLGGLLD